MPFGGVAYERDRRGRRCRRAGWHAGWRRRASALAGCGERGKVVAVGLEDANPNAASLAARGSRPMTSSVRPNPWMRLRSMSQTRLAEAVVRREQRRLPGAALVELAVGGDENLLVAALETRPQGHAGGEGEAMAEAAGGEGIVGREVGRRMGREARAVPVKAGDVGVAEVAGLGEQRIQGPRPRAPSTGSGGPSGASSRI